MVPCTIRPSHKTSTRPICLSIWNAWGKLHEIYKILEKKNTWVLIANTFAVSVVLKVIWKHVEFCGYLTGYMPCREILNLPLWIKFHSAQKATPSPNADHTLKPSTQATMPLSFSFRLFLFSIYEELDKQKLTHQKKQTIGYGANTDIDSGYCTARSKLNTR